MIIFSSGESAAERQLGEIFTACGAKFISDRKITSGSNFTAAVARKKVNIALERGVVLFLDGNFGEQCLSRNLIGVCEDSNLSALKLFSKNQVPVISFGMNSRNTVTISSFSGSVMVSVQRTFRDIFGKSVAPGEFCIQLKKDYSPFAIMAAASSLLLHGIIPEKF